MGGGSALVSRMMQTWFPTPLEKSQLDAIAHNRELALQRLASEELRSERELEARREILLQQHEGNMALEDRRTEQARSPLLLAYSALVKSSQRSPGKRLNVIIKAASRLGPDDDQPARLKQINHAVSSFIDSLPGEFGQSLAVYKETTRATELFGRQLADSIYSATYTESVALLEISAMGPHSIGFGISCWGWAGDSGGVDEAPRFHVDISQTASPVDAIEDCVRAIVVALDDRFRLVTNLSSTPSLNSFLLAKNSEHSLEFKSTARPLSEAKVALVSRSLATILVESHEATLDQIASRAPAIAVDAAAHSAIQAREAGLLEASEALLERSMTYLGQAVPRSPEHELTNYIASSTGSMAFPQLARALCLMRGIAVAPTNKKALTTKAAATNRGALISLRSEDKARRLSGYLLSADDGGYQ